MITFIQGIETRLSSNNVQINEIFSNYNKEEELKIGINSFIKNSSGTMKIVQPGNDNITDDLEYFIKDKGIELLKPNIVKESLGTFNKIKILEYMLPKVSTRFMAWVDVDVLFTNPVKQLEDKFYANIIDIEETNILEIYNEFDITYPAPSKFIPSCVIIGPTNSFIWKLFIDIANELFDSCSNRPDLVPHCEELALGIVYELHKDEFINTNLIAYQEEDVSYNIACTENTSFYHYHNFSIFFRGIVKTTWSSKIIQELISNVGMLKFTKEFNISLKEVRKWL